MCDNQRADRCPKVAIGTPKPFEWIKYKEIDMRVNNGKGAMFKAYRILECERYKPDRDAKGYRLINKR
jgi:hypothetical protein